MGFWREEAGFLADRDRVRGRETLNGVFPYVSSSVSFVSINDKHDIGRSSLDGKEKKVKKKKNHPHSGWAAENYPK